jgi:hypothetical protein
MNVHRLRYMIHTRCIQLNPENYHISHLCQCHTKTCVNISHLSLEPPHVNNSRQNCLSQQCFSHCHLKGFWLFEYNLVIILRKCRVQNVFTYVLSFSMIISWSLNCARRTIACLSLYLITFVLVIWYSFLSCIFFSCRFTRLLHQRLYICIVSRMKCQFCMCTPPWIRPGSVLRQVPNFGFVLVNVRFTLSIFCVFVFKGVFISVLGPKRRWIHSLNLRKSSLFGWICAVLWWPFWKLRPVEIFQCWESIQDIIIYPHIKFWRHRTMLNCCGHFENGDR